MKSNIKDKVTAIGFTAVLVAVLLVNIILPDQELSRAERRRLDQMPEFTAENVVKGDFFEDLEEYALDQFLLRDALRTVKSTVRLNVFMQLENNDLFLQDGNIFKLPPEVNEPGVKTNCGKMLSTAQKIWPDANMYYSIIPEKNMYLDSNAYPRFDSEQYDSIVAANLPGVQKIDISDLLSLDDYYLTDPHWRQENIVDVADRLLTVMGNPDVEGSYEQKNAISFHGTYHGQLPLNVEKDELNYLTGANIEAAQVYNFETQKTTGVYNHDKLTAMDPYDFYLDGACALLRIENPQGTPGKELVIFRDSFGSSIAPLMLSDYETVTLVDLRYVASVVLDQFVSAGEQTDVLFLYSQTILNNNGVFR